MADVGTPMTEHPQPGRRRYVNPPVVEAIARLSWAIQPLWTVTTPGTLFEHFKSIYPAPPQVRNRVRAGIGAGPEPEAQGQAIEVTAGPQEMIFATEDRTRLVVIGPESISVHGLTPYEGWESLSARLLDAYQVACDALDVSPQFSQASVRYINRVELAEPQLQFTDYLTIGFVLPPSFPPTIGGFLDRVETVYSDAPVRLAFTWASTPAGPGKAAFILDFDLTYQTGDPFGSEGVREILDDMKAKETAAFESLLKDRLRSIFVEVD